MAGIWLFSNHNYYDEPEGHAPFEKMFACGKWGFAGGLLAYTMVAFKYKARTYRELLRISSYYIVPSTAIGVSFAAVTYCAVNIRKKDDITNYLIGFLPTIGIVHKWGRARQITLSYAIFGGLAVTVKKYGVLHDWRFFPEHMVKREVIKRRDFSLTQDPRYTSKSISN